MEIHQRAESDHLPVVVKIVNDTESNTETNREKNAIIETEDWSEEGVRKYRKNLTNMKEEIENAKNIEELSNILNKAISKNRITLKPNNLGHRKWWDKECRMSKRELNRCLREMIKNKISKEEYQERKRKHKSLLEKKENNYKNKEQKRVMSITSTEELWAYIRRETGIKSKVSERIKAEEWHCHFTNLLEGQETRPHVNNRRTPETPTEQTEITAAEVIVAIKKLKKKKSAGTDKIRNEAWKYAEPVIREALRKQLNEVWKGAGWPEGWKTGLITPIFKKGNKDDPSNYRGITLMDTSYKRYVTI